MWMRRLNCRGQNTAEYAIVISLVVAAAMAMQIYVKRGLQGKVKGVMDGMATQGPAGPAQYEPYYVQNQTTQGQTQDAEEEYTSGAVRRTGSTTVTGTGTRDTLGAEALGADGAWQ